ncbi:MAG: N-acetylmuramoyl-L-alanine amidase, partial [Longimicrobiales bacterium]
MRIARHRLHGDTGGTGEIYDFRPTPNRGGALQAEYLVMHYTAGRSLEESVDWLARKESKASAHVVIGRDGTIVQQVPFDTVAWHAGASSWDGRTGMNRWSIGIELDNAGRLMRHGSGWRAWFGGFYEDEDVIVATHKNESVLSGWHTYTPAQLEAALTLAALLVDRYNLRDVLGHDDISPGRKSDPGPAFPMDSFRSRIFGRREDELPEYRAMAALNIRTGPGTRHATLPGSPLRAGTRMHVLRAQDSWRLVDVLDD